MAINKKVSGFSQSPGLNVAQTESKVRQGLGLNITLSEVKFVCIIALLLLVITSIPTLYGYVTAPADKWFSGIVENVHDTAQYLSWMRESGHSLFIENKLTSEANDKVFLNLHWWIPGRVAAILGLSLSQIYQILRLFAIPFLVIVTYIFCALLFDDLTKRRFTFLLSICTSGLGWIWVVKKQFTGELDFPRDVHTTLGNAFYTMVSSPHLAFAAALTLLVLLLALQSVRLRRLRLSVGAGLLALFLGTGHIYDLVTVWAVLGIFGLLLSLRDGWSWRTFWSLSIVVLFSLPTAFYWQWVSSDAHPMWQQALAQYDNLGVFTPDPFHLIILLGFCFIVALATFTGFVSLKHQTDGQLFIKSWFGIVLLLIYLPLHFQIMLLTGYQLPLAVLATWGLFDHILPWLQEHWPNALGERWLSRSRLNAWVPLLFLILVLPTNLYLFAWRVVDLGRHNYPFYLYQDELQALQWLDRHTDPNEVVLSSFVIGHYVPGLAGNKAFLANAVMTMDFYCKQELVTTFFGSEMSDEERAALLQQYGVDYVFYGPAEQALGNYDPATSSLFSQVFVAPRVKVFQANVDNRSPQLDKSSFCTLKNPDVSDHAE
ncbi:MAG: hypothetical protein KJ077_09565 [Anaerolineae bacterium]|nr:hypothetical protein [Anaerolineae bacterium]